MTLGVSGPLLVVDLSNLCRDRRLLAPGQRADLTILDRLERGLVQSEITVGRVHSVADKSLRRHLSEQDQEALRSLEKQGKVEFSTVADEVILDMAFGQDADGTTLVASHDFFDDFRRIYPHIQGSTNRFLTWAPNADGELTVTWRDMEVRRHQQMSRKEESEELRARRLYRTTVVRRAVGHYYRCINTDCLLGQLWPERLPDLPRYDDRYDRFVCPSCRRPLEQGELRAAATQLIFFLHGAEQFRVLLDEGDQVTVGRREAKGCVGLQTRLPEGTVEAISRSHVAFHRSGGQVVVEDLESRNGTMFRLPGTPDEAMAQGKVRSLGLRGTIALPSGVTIERSGRSMPIDGARFDDSVLPDEDPRATRMLSRP